MSGKGPVRDTVARSRSIRLEEEVRSVGKDQGWRAGLEPRLRVWREVREEKAEGGTEVKLLRFKYAVWRNERLEREGRVPERELSWRERVRS